MSPKKKFQIFDVKVRVEVVGDFGDDIRAKLQTGMWMDVPSATNVQVVAIHAPEVTEVK